MKDEKDHKIMTNPYQNPEGWQSNSYSYPTIAIGQKPKLAKISFCNDDKVLGSLSENEDGRLTFSGDMEASAKVFFEFCCNTWPNMAEMRSDANKYQAILPLITAISEASSHSKEDQAVSNLIEHMEGN